LHSIGYLQFSFEEAKLVAPLIATPNVDNANGRQEKSKKLNYKLHVICMQKGIVFVFANNLDGSLVPNYAIDGFKKGEWWERFSFPPVFMS
jgi:hypothetical protein